MGRTREKLKWGVSKPRGFPLFSGKVRIVSRTLSELFLIGAVNRPRKEEKDKIGKIPGQSPDKSGNSRKIGKGQNLKGPKIEKNQDRPPGLKFSIEIETFKRATQQTPIFVGNSEGRD